MTLKYLRFFTFKKQLCENYEKQKQKKGKMRKIYGNDRKFRNTLE